MEFYPVIKPTCTIHSTYEKYWNFISQWYDTYFIPFSTHSTHGFSPYNKVTCGVLKPSLLITSFLATSEPFRHCPTTDHNSTPLKKKAGKYYDEGPSVQLPMQSVPIAINVVSLNPTRGEVYSIQHYVIKFVSDLWQVAGFLQVFQFPPPIKLTATI